MNSPSEILKMPYARVVTPESDGSFRAEILEFQGCVALGDTESKALESLQSVATGWLETVIEQGLAIPAPFEQNEDYSGKFVVRLPKSLHKQAAMAAKRDGVSLNQFITYSIAEQVGARSVAHTATSAGYFVFASVTGTSPGAVIGFAGPGGVSVSSGYNRAVSYVSR